MASPKKTLETVLQGGRNIAFRDLQRLLEKLGFRLNRVSGSHHIYLHPRVPRPMNVQAVGKDAKPYQVRQLKGIIKEFGLRLEE
jgi:predicted RNA binding protein YcfA (HicA-like mRNA interferase family)